MVKKMYSCKSCKYCNENLKRVCPIHREGFGAECPCPVCIVHAMCTKSCKKYNDLMDKVIDKIQEEIDRKLDDLRL